MEIKMPFPVYSIKFSVLICKYYVYLHNKNHTWNSFIVENFRLILQFHNFILLLILFNVRVCAILYVYLMYIKNQ